MTPYLEAALRDAVECRCLPNIDDIDDQNILFEIEKLKALCKMQHNELQFYVGQMESTDAAIAAYESFVSERGE